MCICWCSCYAVSSACQPTAALKPCCEQNNEICCIDWDGSESPLTESPILTFSSAYKPFVWEHFVFSNGELSEYIDLTLHLLD